MFRNNGEQRWRFRAIRILLDPAAVLPQRALRKHWKRSGEDDTRGEPKIRIKIRARFRADGIRNDQRVGRMAYREKSGQRKSFSEISVMVKGQLIPNVGSS